MPLLAVWLGVIQPGRVSKADVAAVDWLPTALSLVGVVGVDAAETADAATSTASGGGGTAAVAKRRGGRNGEGGAAPQVGRDASNVLLGRGAPPRSARVLHAEWAFHVRSGVVPAFSDAVAPRFSARRRDGDLVVLLEPARVDFATVRAATRGNSSALLLALRRLELFSVGADPSQARDLFGPALDRLGGGGPPASFSLSEVHRHRSEPLRSERGETPCPSCPSSGIATAAAEGGAGAARPEDASASELEEGRVLAVDLVKWARRLPFQATEKMVLHAGCSKARPVG